MKILSPEKEGEMTKREKAGGGWTGKRREPGEGKLETSSFSVGRVICFKRKKNLGEQVCEARA